jgi:outer membrane protein OmpA-like peptidoglycan-associated protein
MNLKQPVFILTIVCIASFLTACAGPTKIVSAPLQEISLSPPPAMIIKENYIFAYETARCAKTPQFLITRFPYSISPPEKALKIDLRMFTPKASSTEAIQTLFVFFPVRSSTLDSQETQKLIQFIQKLKQQKIGPVDVVGYTCRLGSQEYNQKLALNRARTVADYLKRHRISVASVTGEAGGGYVSDADPSQNRRVEITLSPPPDQPITDNHKGGGSEIEP